MGEFLRSPKVKLGVGVILISSCFWRVFLLVVDILYVGFALYLKAAMGIIQKKKPWTMDEKMYDFGSPLTVYLPGLSVQRYEGTGNAKMVINGTTKSSSTRFYLSFERFSFQKVGVQKDQLSIILKPYFPLLNVSS